MTIFNKNTPLCLGFPLATQIYILAVQRDAKKLCQSLFVPSSVNSTVFFSQHCRGGRRKGSNLTEYQVYQLFLSEIVDGEKQRREKFPVERNNF